MSLRGINQEPISRDNSEEKSFLYQRQNSVTRSSYIYTERPFNDQYDDRRFPRARRLRLISSPMRLLKHIAGEIARAFCMVSVKRKPSSSSSLRSGDKNYMYSARSKPFVAPLDSHRVEAIEDCIQFINSSSNFSRSNSITTTTNTD